MITKNTVLSIFFCLSYPVSLFLSAQDPLQDPFDIKKEIPQVFNIQGNILTNSPYIAKKLGLCLDELAGFSEGISTSSSIEDLLYHFYINRDGSLVFETLSDFDTKEISHDDSSPDFLQKDSEENFLEPVLSEFKVLVYRFNTILTSEFFVERMEFLKESLPEQIKKQKESLNVLKKDKDFQHKDGQEFFGNLLLLHDSTDFFVKMLDIEQILTLKKFDYSKFDLMERLRKLLEKEVRDLTEEHRQLLQEKIDQYDNTIARKMKVLRLIYISRYLAICAPEEKIAPKISNRVKALLCVSLVVGGGAYILPRLFPRLSLTNLRELFLKIAEKRLPRLR